MLQIRNLFNGLDYIVSLWWGLNLMDILPILSSGYVFSTLDNIIKTLFALAGLVYAVIRCYVYYMKGVRENARALLEERKMEQEIEIQKVELYQKFNNEFLKNNK
jgi:hypothetical protein